MDRTQQRLLGLGVATYLLSIFLPAVSCGGGTVPGYDILATGWLGIILLEFRWYANPMFVVIAARVWKAKNSPLPGAWLFLAVVMTTLGVLSIFVPAQACGDAGTIAYNSGLAIGGYLWVASILIVTLTAFRQGQ